MFNLNRDKYRSKLLTYFLPAPSHSMKGYRERQLDHIINQIVTEGFAIEHITTDTISAPNVAGMWIMLLLRPLTPHANNLDLNMLIDNIETHLSQPTSEHVEGLYSID